MVQISNYNIHNILKFKIIRDSKHRIRDLLNLNFTFFEDEDVDDPDITLNIKKFTPQIENCYQVDHKYHIKEDYLYCNDSEGKAKWGVQITGLEAENTIIDFDGNVSGLFSLMYPDHISQSLLLKLIEYKLSNKGYFLVHSAGISKNNEAFVFAGRGGTFKTSLCMDFIRRAGFEFFGDDRVMIHKKGVFSFPMDLNVFGFMCKYLQNENSWNFANKVRFAKSLWDSKSKNDSPIGIGEPTKLKSLFFLVRTNKERITERKIPLKDAVDRLLMNNRLENFISLTGKGSSSGPFLKYELAYSYIFPDSQIATHQSNFRQNVEDILKNIPIYEIRIPNDYSSSEFYRISELVMK